MRRICFIGNSHVSALKEGCDAMQQQGALDKIDITIFGSPRDTLKHCTLKDGKLLPNDANVEKNFLWTSGGLNAINIADYDEVFIITGPSVFSTARYWSGTPLMPLYDFGPISRGLTSTIVTGMMGNWYLTLARQMSNTPAKVPVTHVGAPLTSDADPLSKFILQKLSAPDSQISARLDQLRTQLSEKVSEFSKGNLSFVQPPAHTLEDHGLFTRHEFCEGSKKLRKDADEKHLEDDFDHMNGRYGEALIRYLLKLPT